MKVLAKLPFERKPWAPMLWVWVLFNDKKFKTNLKSQLYKSEIIGITEEVEQLETKATYIGAFDLSQILSLFTIHVFEDHEIQQPPPEEP